MGSQDAGAHFNRGSAQVELGEIDLGLADFTEAISLEEEYADAYASRGLAFTRLGRDAEAGQDLTRAAELGLDRELLERLAEELRQQR